MRRRELQRYIAETYQVDPEFLWQKHPHYMVFRHCGNQKWFAVVMDVPKKKLGLPGEETLDLLDVKCDPAMIGAFRSEAGVYPAYHMSKASWVSLALDDSVSDETVKLLLDISFELTAQKAKRKKK